jgi:ABC-2 type transport system permease protein
MRLPPRLRRSLIRIGAMASKETSHIVRDPRTLYLALVMPVVMLFIFGYGVSFDLDRIPIAFADQDGTATSRSLARAFVVAGEFERVEEIDPADAERRFRRGEALAALVIPRGYSADLARGGSARLQLLVDGADTVVANQVLSKADAIVRAELLRLAGPAASRMAPPV